ncbi:MAG: response regulator [Magnetococcales bacterium]|nr:response regulator [Magnetococcales bacterium]
MADKNDCLAKILVVDDEPVNIELLAEILETDFQVIFATSGAAALKIASVQLPDLILLDIMMPEMDGYEVCERLKADDALKEIPVIIISALGGEADESKGLQSGAVDYITKPFNPTIVKLRVDNHLELKQHRDRLTEMVIARTAELHAAKEKAEAGDRIKSEFLYLISHELRTPLTSIIGFSGLLETKLEAAHQESVRHISQAGERLMVLVDDILDLVKIDTGEALPNHTAFALRELIDQVTETPMDQAKVKGLTLQVQLDQGVGEQVRTDREKLRKILRHLLDNAVKFTDKGAVQLLVAREAPGGEAGERAALRFTIQDSGKGLAPDQQEMIFRYFTQVEAPETRTREGAGLGLALCRRFVGWLGGRIWVESQLGSGSTFYFTVPLL